MIAFANVCDDSNIAAIEAKALAQDPAPSRLKHGHFHLRVHQDRAGALRSTAITFINALAAEVNSVGACHADLFAGRGHNVCEQSRGRCFSVDAGDGQNRNAGALRLREHHIDDRAADRSRRPLGRRQMHPQSGAGVDFDHGTALLAQGAADILCNDVDPSDIQTDHAGRVDHAPGNFGMDRIGDVGRRSACAQVRIAANKNFQTRRWHGIGSETLLGKHSYGRRVDFDEAEYGAVTIAASRVTIRFVDQFANR